MHYEITHITRDRNDPDRSIDAFYGPLFGYHTLDETIAYIANGHTFWTAAGGYLANVWFVPASATRRSHLSTNPDGFLPNNLLSLPEFRQYA